MFVPGAEERNSMSTQEIVIHDQKSIATGNTVAPMKLIEMAVSSNADIDKLERLLELQTKWEAGQSRKEYLDAMAAFQSALPTIKKLKEANFGAGKLNINMHH